MALNDILFRPLPLRNITLPNRLVRSATCEGLGLPDGTPRPELAALYARVGAAGVGTLITGFCFVSLEGRAMQPAQCGCDTDTKIRAWQDIVSRVKAAAPDVKLVMQLAHAGRQTLRAMTHTAVVGASSRRSRYFREAVRPLTSIDIARIVSDFADASHRAQAAGFDGVQVHAAHGYLLHQFLSPGTNNRRDEWRDGARFLTAVVEAIQARCGDTFPVFAKFSAADEDGLIPGDTVQHIRSVETRISAAEISTGTMEYAFNIIRGAHPIRQAFEVNPLLRPVPRPLRGLFRRVFLRSVERRLLPFSENYNLEAATHIATRVRAPVIVVGGFRRAAALRLALADSGMAAVSLCRPFIAEPDLALRCRNNEEWNSSCTNCNLCTIHCDADRPVRCYRNR